MLQVDASGAFLNNSRFYLQKDGGGKIAIDPQYGIAAGVNSLYQMNGTHVTPSFIDDSGNLIMENGMPKNTNFFLDLQNGDFYFKGKGVLNGDLYANNLFFNDGSDVKTLLSQGTKQISSEFLDLGNIKLDGASGNIEMTGDINMNGSMHVGGSIDFTNAGAITWGGNAPVKYQFSTAVNGPWHDTMQSADKYRRDSLDGGKSWGAGYQYKGTDGQDGRDGRDGSDADVPGYIKQTYIDFTQVSSPYILTNMLKIQTPSGNKKSSGLLLGGYYGGIYYDMFKLSYFEGDAANVVFDSPVGAYAQWNFATSYFSGDIDFSSANVTGISARFA